jgi:ADP-heptose:LPS heptosyltransferase
VRREKIRMVDALESRRADAELRITLVRSGGLGDTVLVLPALVWLRKHLCGAHLTLVGSHWAEALSPLLPFPLEVVCFDSSLLTPLFGPDPVGDVPDVFSEAAVLVIYTASPLHDWIRNVRRACRGSTIIWPSAPAGSRHAVVHFTQALAAGLLDSSDVPTPTLHAPEVARAWAREWLRAAVGSPVGLTAIHPGSGGSQKCWPPECFAELARKAHTSILLVEGPADVEACSRVRSLISSAVRVVEARGLGLAETAALLEQCTLYVANDSGLSHVAGALGIPTVAVFGPTDPDVWAPLGRAVAVVRAPEGTGWPTPEAVLEAARHLGAE